MDWAEFVAACIPEPRSILVEAYEGDGAYGQVFAAPVQVPNCTVEDDRRLVPVQTQDAAGATALSTTTICCGPDVVCPVRSRVTLPSGVVTNVLVSAFVDAHGWDLPTHLELSLE